MAGASPRFFNSLGRLVEDFVPAVPGRVGLYTCGPTVYSSPHLGNMRPYVFSDTLRRLLQWKGHQVAQVVNITDVGHTVGENDLAEDKVEVAARRELRSVRDLTEAYTAEFFHYLDALNVLPATHNPRAGAYVPEMIEFATVLEKRGVTYRLPSGLYLDTSKVPGYGRLALIPANRPDQPGRTEGDPEKRSPADFAVWRADAPGERRVLRWDSPWGPGVPGWHLECSVMSMALLGEHFDVHTGGVDHREIHHPNEIAQSESYLADGRDWVRLWMHNEFLLQGSKKIAKSAGRMPLLSDLENAGTHPLVFRYFLLTAHYRSQLDLTDSALDAAASAYRRLLARVESLRPLPDASSFAAARDQLTTGRATAALDRLDAAISDDLATPRFLAELQGISRDADLTDPDRGVLVAAAEFLLGLRLDELTPAEVTRRRAVEAPVEVVEALVGQRSAARAERRWADADRLRDKLLALGVQVTDTPDGPVWESSDIGPTT